MPRIFAAHELTQLWAYKCVLGSTAIGAHADFAAVNVNFWITPDSANRDQSSGGLVIYKRAAPLDWDFAKYNDDVDRISQAIMGVDTITIP